jgi:hypothetical protein
MRLIRELDLVVVLPILMRELAQKEIELQKAENRADELNDEEIDEKCNLQEYLARLDGVITRLKQQYMAALDDKIVLPALSTLGSVVI